MKTLLEPFSSNNIQTEFLVFYQHLLYIYIGPLFFFWCEFSQNQCSDSLDARDKYNHADIHEYSNTFCEIPHFWAKSTPELDISTKKLDIEYFYVPYTFSVLNYSIKKQVSAAFQAMI